MPIKTHIEATINDMEDRIMEDIKTHLEQCVYTVCCQSCGEELDRTTTVDKDLDIIIEVEPCKCQDE